MFVPMEKKENFVNMFLFLWWLGKEKKTVWIDSTGIAQKNIC